MLAIWKIKQIKSPHGEHSPLLRAGTSKAAPQWLGTALRRYRTTRKCITSKVALLILLWSFPVTLTCGLVFNPGNYVQFGPQMIIYGAFSIVFCFFPLTGFLADNKHGRYKMVICSSYIILPAMVLGAVGLGLIIPSPTFISDASQIVGISICSIAALIILVGFVGFTANIVPFGIDQLHDSPGEDQSLFIHWYVWFSYISSFFTRLAWHLIVARMTHVPDEVIRHHKVGISLLLSLLLLAVVLLIISLCVAHHRRRWFLVDSGRVNPYELVYKVTKFAFQHRTPVRRSAFTYCEDELPSGLDLGKNKYGGPFTTEEVEDIKTFYGILKILFSFGTVFFLDLAAKSILSIATHNVPQYYNGTYYNETLAHYIIISNGLLSPLLVVICIPLYLCLVRPFMSYYIPGMLKRMGIGIFFVLLSLMTTFTMDTVLHSSKDKEVRCMFIFNLQFCWSFPRHHLSHCATRFVSSLQHVDLHRFLRVHLFPEPSLHEGDAYWTVVCHQRTL